MTRSDQRKKLSVPPIQVPVFVFRRLASRLRPHRWRLAGATLFLLLSSGIGLAFPLFVRHLMDAAFVAMDRDLLNRIAVMLLGLFVVQGVFSFFQVYLLGSTGERVIAELRRDLFKHLISLSPGFFTERTTGELTSRLTSDVMTLQGVLSYQISELLRQLLYLAGSLVLLTLMHRQLTVTTLAVVPAVVLLGGLFGRRLRRASTEVQDRVADANTVAEEAIVQVRTVQSFVREWTETRRYSARIDSALNAALRRALTRGLFFGVITLLVFGSVAVVLWQGGRMVLAGQITGGQLVSFLLYAVLVAGAVTSLAFPLGRLPGSSGRGRARVRTPRSEAHGGRSAGPTTATTWSGLDPVFRRCLVQVWAAAAVGAARDRPGDPAGRGRGVGGPQRRRQIDAGGPRPPLLGPQPGADHTGWGGSPRAEAGGAALGGRDRAAGAHAVRHHDP